MLDSHGPRAVEEIASDSLETQDRYSSTRISTLVKERPVRLVKRKGTYTAEIAEYFELGLWIGAMDCILSSAVFLVNQAKYTEYLQCLTISIDCHLACFFLAFRIRLSYARDIDRSRVVFVFVFVFCFFLLLLLSTHHHDDFLIASTMRQYQFVVGLGSIESGPSSLT